MEPNTQPNIPINNIPPVNNIPPMGNVQSKSSIGGIIGTIIVIAIIILGGLYFWGKRIDEAKLQQENTQQAEIVTTTNTVQEMPETDRIVNVNDSDEINSLEIELNATNFDGLGAELQ